MPCCMPCLLMSLHSSHAPLWCVVVRPARRRSLRAHAALYAECGHECMTAINAYYKKDIELLHGPDVT